MTRTSSLVFCLLLAACGAEQRSGANTENALAAVMVSTEGLQSRTLQTSVLSYGVIEGLEKLDVASEAAGTVARVLVNEGDAVAAGELLLELDREKQDYRVTQARRQAEQARAALDEAQLLRRRRTELADSGSISREDLDSARLRVTAALANHEQALAAQGLAERELADTRILSPSRGLVEQKFVEAGEPVTVGATLVSLQVTHVMRVQTWVSEADLLLIQPGQQASVELNAAPLHSFEALVEWVGVNADPQTGNYPVKLVLQDESSVLRPGMTASVEIKGLVAPEALLLPESALVHRNRRRVVFVVERQQGKTIARIREPRLAAGFSRRLLVLAGLEAGEEVITDGLDGVVEGSEVTVR